MLGEITSGVDGDDLVFRLPDHDAELDRVRLVSDLLPGPLDLTRTGGVWELRTPRPPLARLEYRFEVTRTVPDPTNPSRVENPFGDRSVLELPGYATPAWLEEEAVASTVEAFTVVGTPVGAVESLLWAPAGLVEHEPAPLLLAHDGPEYARLGGLTQLVGVLVAAGTVPAIRVLLAGAERRERWYAADPDYSDALVEHVLPAVRARWSTSVTLAAGVSLGGLAALHAEWRHPGTFAALLMQSGSFFTPETDPQESGFEGYGPVTTFVADVLAATVPRSTPSVAMTCGAHEENATNNRLMAQHLRRLGVPTTYAETADMHNFTSWRDALDPHLTDLLRDAVGPGRGA